jgi:predicted Zn finger-like uncharacterized protein
MDVQCERCKTEYEFDDALVSERGTTVRCTTCGHQFKVRRTEAAARAAGADEWIVRPPEGPPLTFHTLRDLQQAILSKQVRRSDWLQRGVSAPRPIGSITELEPFFEGRASNRPPAPDAPSGPSAPSAPTTAAVVFPKRGASWEGQDLQPSPESAPTAMHGSGLPERVAPPVPPMRQKIDTLRPPLDAQGAAPPPAPRSEPGPVASPSLTPIAEMGRLAPSAAPEPAPFSPPVVATNDPFGLPPPTRPVRRSMVEEDFESARPGPPSSYDDPYSAPRRRRVGGWIIALSLLFSVGVVGWVVAKPYLVHADAKAAPPADPRAVAFLSQGERALEDADLDLAQQTFDKASVLAEKDPRVLLDQARVTAAKADVPWLKLRLLKTEALDEVRTAHAQLDELVPRARRQAEDAAAAAPDDPAVVRARIDALRLAGARDDARSNVPRLGSLATQPETAYVLAALDLAEPQPVWATVIERLRSAAAAEGTAGRARAALVYALAQSGDVAGARAELVKIDTAARPYPLLPNLHAFLDAAGDKGRPAPAASASATPKASPKAENAPPAVSPPPSQVAVAAGGGDSDPRNAMQTAALAIKHGDFTRAHQIYQSIVDRNPNDSEAVSGLGDVARLQGDPSGAIAFYKRAIAINPSYLPALLGMADTEWVRGDRVNAAKTYKDVVDRFPEGTYPAYVSRRIEGATAPAANPAEPGSPAEPGEHTE